MNENAIQIRGLGKRYHLGGRRAVSRTLGEAISDWSRKLRGLGAADRSEQRGDFWALRDIDLDVKAGEVIGIIGHNGAGKSTLLKILSRTTDPTVGEVQLRGRLASLLEVGTGFHPELTGRENIYLNGSILGMRKAEISRQFDEIVAFSGVEKFLDTPVKRYSSGMRVRLAFAVAAHLEPELLLIDEVLAVGDAAFQAKCLGKMKPVATSQGRTVLFVSHNMASIQQLCSRAVLLRSGQMVADGAPADIVEQYMACVGASDVGDSEDISALDRQHEFGRRARMVSCRVLDARDQPVSQIRFGEPFTVEVAVQANQAIDDLSFIAGIDTGLQQRVVSSMSEEVGRCPSIAADQRVVARWRVNEIRLKPGRYTIALGLRSRKQPIDHLLGARRFDVLPVLADQSLVPNNLQGVIHAKPDWQIDSPMTGSQAA